MLFLPSIPRKLEDGDTVKLLIPRKYARGEEDDVYVKDIEKIDHYELRVLKQVGNYNGAKYRKDTILLVKLPKSKKYMSMLLHPDAGISIDPKFHTQFLREFDEKDRHIIKGFCYKYHDWLINASHVEDPGYVESMYPHAKWFRYTDVPKRITCGRKRDDTEFYRNLIGDKLNPYDESYDCVNKNIFENIRFLNT